VGWVLRESAPWHEPRSDLKETMSQLIFLVDHDLGDTYVPLQSLEQAGYRVRCFQTIDILAEAQYDRPVLLLVGMMLSDGNGIYLCRAFRSNPLLAHIPIVFMLDEDSEEHRILALNSGGDDCIVKPFSARELTARVQAVLRRLAPQPGIRKDSPELIIDSLAMKLSVRGSEVPTTSLEFRLIEYLARHPGQVFTRDLLLDAVWGEMQFVTPRSVDACIRRIREKIEPDHATPTYLKTVRGVGYRLDAEAGWRLTSSEGCNCPACATPVGILKMRPARPARRKKAAQAD
jgi:two-component system phosphate regulon response regulator PhoB